jgi:cation transport regulator ChaB
MPYSSAKEVPSNVPAGKKRQFMAVFNSVYSDTKDEGRAMAAAYSAIKKSISTGDRVSWNSSGGTARGIVRQIVRDGTVPNIPVKITGSEDEPAARIEIVDDEGKPTGEMVGHKLSTLRKAKYANDIFTTREEAMARSMDMGFGGETHVHEYMGQAVYMPAESHEDYLEYYQEGDYSEEAEGGSVDRLEALRAIVAEVMKTEFQKAEYQGEKVTLNKPRRIQGGNKKFEVFVMDGEKVKRVTFGDPNMEIRRDDPKARANFRSRHSCDTASDKTSARYWSCRMWESDTSVSEMTKANIEGKILKADDEQRMVYGWASVVTEKGEPVVDRQGDVIEPETLVKAVNNFMEHIRVGKAMHTGEQVGVVVHSFPVTKELGDALGIHSDREGWIVAYKVYDDAVWNMVKSGELAAFSIGGRAMKEEI